MEENKSTLAVAVALKPIMEYLYKLGVLSVEGCYHGAILLTEQKFREIWPDVTPDNTGFLTAELDGHIFTAFVPEAKKNG